MKVTHKAFGVLLKDFVKQFHREKKNFKLFIMQNLNIKMKKENAVRSELPAVDKYHVGLSGYLAYQIATF